MKLSVKVPRSKETDAFGHVNIIEFVVKSSEHSNSRACFAEIGGTVKAINRDAYAIFKDALDDLKE